ncbi:unnamed protein product [Peniophora sp. CBMAI 1063]|nr:unnamed protein product [Peniophora sp. CBMAI 1063]
MLTDEQNEAVNAFVKGDFVTYIREHNPTYNGFGGITDWVSERRTNMFAEHAAFKTHDSDAPNLVDRKIRNYYYHLRDADPNVPPERKSAKRKAPGRKASARKSPNHNPTKPRKRGQLYDLLVPRTTALELYECDVKQELEEVSDDEGESYRARLKKGWEALSADAHLNYENCRRLLVENMRSGLNELCRTPSLANMTALSVFAYRDAQGEMKLDVCDGRLADDSPQFGSRDDEKGALKTLTDLYKAYACRSIPALPPPQPPSPEEIAIPYNALGIPIYPEVDTMLLPPDALKTVTVRYFEVLWEYAHNVGELPWDNLKREPGQYYDVERFHYISFDRSALMNPLSLYALVSQLQAYCGPSAEEPFVFTPSPGHAGQWGTSIASSDYGERPQESRASGAEGGATDAPAPTPTTAHLGDNSTGASERHTLSNSGVDRSHQSPVTSTDVVASPIAQESPLPEPDCETPAPLSKTCSGAATSPSELGLPMPDVASGGAITGTKRGSKRAIDVLPKIAEERRQPKRSRKDGEEVGKPSGEEGRPQRTLRPRIPATKTNTTASKVTAPRPRSNKKVFEGWEFNNSIYQGAILHSDYVACGGTRLQEEDFALEHSRVQIAACDLAERDPAWFARSSLWKSAIKSRPDM